MIVTTVEDIRFDVQRKGIKRKIMEQELGIRVVVGRADSEHTSLAIIQRGDLKLTYVTGRQIELPASSSFNVIKNDKDEEFIRVGSSEPHLDGLTFRCVEKDETQILRERFLGLSHQNKQLKLSRPLLPAIKSGRVSLSNLKTELPDNAEESEIIEPPGPNQNDASGGGAELAPEGEHRDDGEQRQVDALGTIEPLGANQNDASDGGAELAPEGEHRDDGEQRQVDQQNLVNPPSRARAQRNRRGPQEVRTSDRIRDLMQRTQERLQEQQRLRDQQRLQDQQRPEARRQVVKKPLKRMRARLDEIRRLTHISRIPQSPTQIAARFATIHEICTLKDYQPRRRRL